MGAATMAWTCLGATEPSPLRLSNPTKGLRKRCLISAASAVPQQPLVVSKGFAAGQKFPLSDVVEAQQFDRELLDGIFQVALQMEATEKDFSRANILGGYLMATLFYEPSTRTRLSFESAMKRLGGQVLTTENAREFSSAAKGETLEDTIRTVEGYSDIIVLRHFENGAAKQAAAAASIPVINAGDGPGQHPTQALLDVYTIQKEIGRLDGIKVGLVGDLANGRTVRSLAYLLSKYEGVKLYFVAPDVVKMKDDIKDYLTSKNIDWEETSDLMEVAANCDVVYQTRIQRERFGDKIDLYNEARGKFIVDGKVLKALRKHAVILHPLPRLDEVLKALHKCAVILHPLPRFDEVNTEDNATNSSLFLRNSGWEGFEGFTQVCCHSSSSSKALPRLDEITIDVDADPRAAYFRQAKNGLHIRMALLKLLLLGW